ncbi:cytochrome c biogenesis heme-transporting ATPase CcmA [Sedimenticola selenatireducens]|uniref:Heme ABC transporter ATP-binding protein CcmA n=1 Tax=Sedimenticola selenatireducens TaxID=191960 RepID=A0A2N6CZF9_9GAMM|nr:cytochrome c biogenesis heme-transporting ATPase CcmA [Sedimenticola selenatireducens]PLX62765.1 MAG: heme ABC transporter ATP-binding protein CcmA [Sedimenticola selenatireducens]
MLEVAGLACIRGDRKLFSDLSFRLEAGELLHLRGHNGSGKTTLMRTVCGLMKESDGEIRWNGESIHRLGEDFTRDVVYIGHKNGIKDDLTGVENLRVCSALDGNPITERQAWDALERMGLMGHEDLPSRVLSQGQKRRVALARLLVNKSRLWVLDEPFTALDVAAVDFLQSIIRDHINSGGMVILTTHQEVRITREQVKELQLGWKEVGHV